MKRTFIQVKFIFMMMLAMTILPAAFAQVEGEISFISTHDMDFGGGHSGADGGYRHQIRIANTTGDNSAQYDAYFKFNIADSVNIPQGMTVLSAKLQISTTANDGPETPIFVAYHVQNDNWDENLAISDANKPDLDVVYEEYIDKSSFTGGNASILKIDVKKALLKELEAGDAFMTIKIDNEAESYYAAGARDMMYQTNTGSWEYGWYLPHLVISYGYAPDPVFSENGDFGDMNNYSTRVGADGRLFYNEYGIWTVVEDEGDMRYQLAQRPAPYKKESTSDPAPGSYSVLNDKTFGDFTIQTKAKVNATKDDAVKAKTDFILVFGFIDEHNYCYMQFQAGNPGGFYQVVDGSKSLVGAENETAAIPDTAYHNYKLVRTGNKVQAYIDDNVDPYLEVEDAALGAEGQIGMGSYNDIVFFDDFVEGDGPVNLTALTDAIAAAQDEHDNATIGTGNGEYPQEVVDALQTAIDAAQTVADNTEVDQPTVDAAVVTLADAVDTFHDGVIGVNRANLIAAIEAAQTQHDEATGYLDEHLITFQNAIDAAQDIADNTEASQEDVDAAETTLAAAVSAFEAISGISETVNAEFSLFPNPATNVLQVESDVLMQKIVVSNIVGQNIQYINDLNAHRCEINVSEFSSGIYLISVHNIDGTINCKRFIKE